MLGAVCFRTLVMGVAGMDVCFKLATSLKLDAITLFQAISCFKNFSHGQDRMDVIFELAASHKLVIITFPNQFQVLRTVQNPSHGSGWYRGDLQTGNFS